MEVDGVVDVVGAGAGVCSGVGVTCGACDCATGALFVVVEAATTVEVSTTVATTIGRGATTLVESVEEV